MTKKAFRRPAGRDAALQDKMDELCEVLLSDDWLYRKSKGNASGRDIKIRAGVEMVHRVHKAPGGIIRAQYAVVDGLFADLYFSGDFFCYPSNAIEHLEASLQGQVVAEAGKLLQTF